MAWHSSWCSVSPACSSANHCNYSWRTLRCHPCELYGTAQRELASADAQSVFIGDKTLTRDCFFRAFPALPHRASGEQAACRARSLRCKSASAATRVRSCSILPYPRRAARPTALHDIALFGGVPFEARAPLALAATDGTTGLCSRV